MAGELLRWSDEDQLKFFSAMREAGLTDETDPRVRTALDESLPVADRARAADEIITERYGAGYFNSSLVEHVEFPEEERTPEEQAAFDAWQAENWKRYDGRTPGPMEGARLFFLIESDLTEIGEFPREMMRSVETEARWNEEKQCWLVLASMDKEKYVEGMRSFNDGFPATIFDTEGWVENGRVWFGEWYSEDGEYLGRYRRYIELGQEEAWKIAEKAAREQLHMTDEIMNSMRFDAARWDGNVYDLTLGRLRPVWHFGWSVEEQGKYWVEIDAYTGAVTEAVNVSEIPYDYDGIGAWVHDLTRLLWTHGLKTDWPENKTVWDLPLEDLAAYSETAYPLARQYLNAHPEAEECFLGGYISEYEVLKQYEWLFELGEHRYGVPGKGAISRDKAVEIAREAIVEKGERPQDAASCSDIQCRYDVTDPAHPVWTVHLGLPFDGSDSARYRLPTDPSDYIVTLNGQTGEVTNVEMSRTYLPYFY